MLTYVIIGVALVLLLIIGAALNYQFRGVYGFDPTSHTPQEVGLPDARVVTFKSEDGVEVSAWLIDAKPGKHTLLSFFGNFACVGPSAERMKPLLDRGYGMAMLVYRGSSGDANAPGEDVFAMDARALYDQLDTLFGAPVPVDKRVLHGVSLGSSVAAGLARDRKAAGIVLESSLDTLVHWHRKQMHGLPMGWMWRDRHDVLDKLRAADPIPLLQVHGERDRAVLMPWARALYDGVPGDRKQFVSLGDGDHMDLLEKGAVDYVVKFVDAL